MSVAKRHSLPADDHLNEVDAENDAGQRRRKGRIGEVVKSPAPDLSGIRTYCGRCLCGVVQIFNLLFSGRPGGPHFNSAGQAARMMFESLDHDLGDITSRDFPRIFPLDRIATEFGFDTPRHDIGDPNIIVSNLLHQGFAKAY